MDLISLLVLVATIAIAFAFKLNTGIVALAASLILSLATGTPEKLLTGSFDGKLFLTLLGVMYLFSIAQENKTLELLAKKVFALCKGNRKILPIVIFLFAAVISAVGPGLISVTALVSVLLVALAKEMDTPPIRLIPFGMMGAFAGGLSPITPSGIVGITKAAEQGITGIENSMPWMMALTCVIYAIILYFFAAKWHKEKKATPATDGSRLSAPTPAFTPKQIITLAGIVAVAVVSSVFSLNVGLVAFAVAVILTLCKVSDEGAALKKVPWGTLIMITGVGILISLVTELGGIKLLSDGLLSLSNSITVAPITALVSGIMSWFSSASGVVMPTMIKTVPNMTQAFPGANAVELVNCISIGANMAAISPLSSCGGLMLAAYTASGDISLKDRNKMFLQLFLLSAGAVALTALCALIGIY